MPSHLVAHIEAKGTSSAVQSELVTIQHLEANPEQVPLVEEDSELDVTTPEACSEQGSMEWEVHMKDIWESTQNKEKATNDLALLKHFNFLPRDEQQQGSDNPDEADPFVLAREIIVGFE